MLLVGTAGVLEAQDSDTNATKQGPVGHLMRFQAELGLSPSQITRLQQIDERMDQQNQPLVARLSQVRATLRSLGEPERLSAEQRKYHDDQMGEFRRLLRRIEHNNHAAMKEVGEVLTPPQQERLGKLLKEQNAHSGRNDNSSSAPRRD